MPTFVDTRGVVLKGRRSSSGEDQALDQALAQNKLHELIRAIHKRLKGVEGRTPPDWIEFELNVDATGTTPYYLNHNFGGPVRYYVTHWTRQDGGAAPTAAPNLRSSFVGATNNTLVLTSTVAGKAVVRVEPSLFEVGT